ncbi:MAG: DUF362 domain-containing protein [Candidatus Latescibacter sp.]|nr:DUF362 domain-containing protein [Candidatus Latescibacter sp.]
MLTRRSFIKMTAAAGGMAMVNPVTVLAKRQQPVGFFSAHPFIEEHPEAVFIIKTTVDKKTNGDAIKQAGLDFSKSVIVPAKKGIPLSWMVPIKPNLTNSFTSKKHYPKQATQFPLEYGMGIVTDPYFVEGVIEGMKGLGMSGKQFYVREVTTPWDFGPRGYVDMCWRQDADIRSLYDDYKDLDSNDLNWVEFKNSEIFKKAPYLWPVNAKNTWLLNISKFKAHGMSLTLCCKNLQGTMSTPFQHYCSAERSVKEINGFTIKDVLKRAKENYDRHAAAGIPRWKTNTGLNGYTMDIWCSRTLDNVSHTPAGLHIIEGVYGRDGDGFLAGPNKGPYSDQEAWDYMTNYVIFGKDPFRVDIVGLWLGGHEAGNVGLYHIAMERKLSNVLDPRKVPVYLWENGTATLKKLEDFERKPLKTYYMQLENEPKYHLLDQPFDYSKIAEGPHVLPRTANARVLNESIPNPANNSVSLEYGLPRAGNTRLEIADSRGRTVDLLVDGPREKGYHMAVWNIGKHSPGEYAFKFRSGDVTRVEKIAILK